MKLIVFDESNIVFAEDQPEYLPLPAYLTPDGEVISCWQFSLLERLQLLFTGILWSRVLTCGKPLQPQLFELTYPFMLGTTK